MRERRINVTPGCLVIIIVAFHLPRDSKHELGGALEIVSFNSLILEMRKLQPFSSSAFSFVMWGVWARFSLSTKGCPLNKTKAQVCTDFQLMPLFTSHLLALMEKPGGKWVDVERAVRMYTVASGA